MGINRKYLLLGVDLFWVLLSPFAALLIRDHFAPRAEALTAATIYAGLIFAIAAVCLSARRPQSHFVAVHLSCRTGATATCRHRDGVARFVSDLRAYAAHRHLAVFTTDAVVFFSGGDDGDATRDPGVGRTRRSDGAAVFTGVRRPNPRTS